jgi:hypothetical protein
MNDRQAYFRTRASSSACRKRHATYKEKYMICMQNEIFYVKGKIIDGWPPTEIVTSDGNFC